MSRSLRERFMEKFIKGSPEECWPWLAAVNAKGYGVIRDEDTMRLAHRIAWVFENGSIPDGLCVLHSCDTPACVNPKHLFLGTNMDNTTDMIQKGRMAVGSKIKSSVLTDDDVREIRLLYCPFIVTQEYLAERFGVTRATISRIINRQQWQHL